MFRLLILLINLTIIFSFHIGHRATCERKKLCNGNLMCAYVCERGTVELDTWATDALKYQRQLQKKDNFVFLELPSTHNSAISEADGYGIEKYFISALGGGLNMDDGDDVGEGVCQYLSLTDQMRMGIRHVEIDIWWGRLENDVVVCHSPIPLFPVGEVNREAEAAGLDLEWEPMNMSCAGTKRMLPDVLTEIKDFLVKEENKEDIFTVYFDTKFYLSPEAVTQANNEILDIFGSMVWKYTDGSPLDYTVEEMLALGKRIIFENQREEWLYPSEGDAIVFYPAIWQKQFGASSMVEFPNCTVEGDSSWYGKQQIRALDGSFTEAATRCGVQVISGDYVNPDDMKLFVWSWDQQEPSLSDGCVAMLPSGRWATLDCSIELPFACLKTNTEQPAGYGLDWNIDLTDIGTWDSAHKCPEGSTFSAPHNGYSNNVLVLQGYGQTMWLNALNPLQPPNKKI